MQETTDEVHTKMSHNIGTGTSTQEKNGYGQLRITELDEN